MININRNNYEEFFIDYIDGNLNAHEIAELMLFLVENPDLEKELKSVTEISQLLKNKSFDNKKLLKKDENTLSGSALHDKCIAKIEGDLSENQLLEFEKELKSNENLKNELKQFEKTILIKDRDIKYPAKDALKKETKQVLLFNKNLLKYAAALIPFIVGGYFYLQNNSTKTINKKYVATNYSTPKIINIDDFAQESNVKVDDFKIVKRETPSIVSQSVNKLKINKPVVIDIKNQEELHKLEIIKTQKPILIKDNYADFVKKENTEITEKEEQKVNYIDPYDIANNEIDKEKYIEEFIKYHNSEHNSAENSTKSFTEGVASFFSNVTSVFKFKAENVGDKKVYDFALAGKKFEIGRKVNKKKK